MNTTEPTDTNIPPEIMADFQAVLKHVMEGTPIEPELSRRVSARAEANREKILALHGVQDIGVQYIRELRGELPS